MANFELANKIKIVNPNANVDSDYGTYATISDACAAIPFELRALGKTVGIIENGSVVEYWWKSGTADANLVKKNNGEETFTFTFRTGAITATTNTVNIALHESGSNSVTINGTTYSKTTADTFNYTPVTSGQKKTLLIYAKADSQIFYLSEIGEIPLNSRLVATITVDENGGHVDSGNSTYKNTSHDMWKVVNIMNENPTTIIVNAFGGSFDFNVSSSVTAPKFGNISAQKFQLYYWDGREFMLRNFSGKDIQLVVNEIPETETVKYFTLREAGILKNGTWMIVKIKGGKLEVVKFGGGAEFPEGVNGQVLEFDSSMPEKVKWVEKIKGVATNFLHYWNGTNWINSGVEWLKSGFLKVTSIVLSTNSGTALPLELGTDGSNVWFGATKRKLRYQDSTVFVYTPTGNFTISQVKTAMESAGYVFNDSHIIVNLGANNYTCSIDIGASNPNTIITIGKRGSGSVSFNSTRTLNSGVDAITIMNGNEGSMTKMEFGTTTDFLTVRNL